MSTKLQEVIELIPEAYRPTAEKYLPVLVNMTMDEVAAMLRQIIAGDWKPAYEKLTADMDTSELGTELNQLNTDLAEQNKESLEKIAYQKEALTSILTVMFSGLKAAVGLI